MSQRPFLSNIDQRVSKIDVSEHKKAVFILHDQLNMSAWPDWIREEKPLLIFIESRKKGQSLPYHKKKLIFVLSAMRHFAIECCNTGFPVCYHATNGHFDDGIWEVLSANTSLEFSFMTPSEWDTRKRIQAVAHELPNPSEEIPNGFFLTDADEFKEKVKDGWRLEFFYREMRRRTGYLMDGSHPEGGEWNYDEQNRKKLPAKHQTPVIQSTPVDEITEEVIELGKAYFGDHFGSDEDFDLAVTRDQALAKLDEFITQRLDLFGPYEDAMASGKHTIYHSMLSIYMNAGLLLPGEMCDAAEKAYKEGKARLNSVEGFIRQIIGWREYIRVYYEAMMPDVREANYFGFQEDLPSLYWSGETKMKCMSECVKPVLEDGYSHHIPRLMVLSNFSNLTRTDPGQLNDWFHLAYVDAYEWVVLPNVLGMSTFADGGILASKPYVAGGNYINKMSDYCKHCAYSIKEKTGETACPFNYLYWNFVQEQRETFTENGRANFMVNMWNKKSAEEQSTIIESSEQFIKALERGYS
ncbi:MAG: cryptochrome/photolyase family protein [Bacteroidota bacterium]